MKVLIFWMLVQAASGTIASAQGLVVSLVSPPQAVAPGTPVKLDLLAVNPGVTEAVFEASASLHGVLWVGAQSWPVELQAGAPEPQTLRPGQFAHRGYTLELPADAKGRVVLEITEGSYAPLRTVLLVDTDSGRKAAAALPVSTLDAASPAMAQVQRSFVGHFAPHEPIYFIYGSKVPAAKFQFSFKYRVLDFQGDAASTAQRSLQFGYTQRSLWDLAGNSSPFYDTSYMPSLFYESRATQSASNRVGPFVWIGFQTGYQHESNGQNLSRSRSLNTLFARSAFSVGSLGDWHVLVVPRVWAYVGDLSDNANLKDYRGYGDVQLFLGKNDGPALAYTGRAGREFNHFTTQLDLTVPIRLKVFDFATYFLVQYFNGYGESLRDYDMKSAALRAGFSLVR